MIDVNEIKKITETKGDGIKDKHQVKMEKFFGSWRYRRVCRRIDRMIKYNAKSGMDYLFVSLDFEDFDIIPNRIKKDVWKKIMADYKNGGFDVYEMESQDLMYKISWSK